MKNLFKISALILAAATLFITGCGKDPVIDPNNPAINPDNPSGTEVGYLTIKGMNLGVSYDTETIVSSGTRASRTEADGAYRLEISDQTTQAVVWSGTYAQIQQMDGPIELAPGRYNLKACSPGEITDVAWENPQYAGQTTFTIYKRETTEVTDLICTLANIKASVELAADLKALFKKDSNNPLATTVAVETAECEFSRDETRNAFFKAPAVANTMTVTLSGLYNIKGEGETPEYAPVTMTQTISNVKAGQWRKISIAIEHADDGNVEFIVKIETWVYDEKIDVDIMSTYAVSEDTIPDDSEEVTDPNAPVLSFSGQYDIAQPFRITESDFDMDLGTSLNRISLLATPNGSAKVADAYCVFDSDNADFLAALAAAGYTGNKVGLYTTNQASKYAIVNTDANSRLQIKVNDAGMLGLYNFAGTHTAKVVLTDNQNRHSYTTITIQVVKGQSEGSGPEIVWPGNDIDARHTVTSKMDIVVNVTSQTGFTGFIVEISGDILGADELETFELASRMDLVNPATDAIREALTNFGFLPEDGSSILGKTSLSFNISDLVPLLGNLGRTGPCDFKLSATDASGTNVKTLMFQVL